MTYWEKGTPCYNTYTLPFVIKDEPEHVYCYKFDHDEGGWWDELIWVDEYNGQDEVEFL